MIEMMKELDSLFDIVLALFRIGELGCFGIALMLVTGKVFKW